MFEEALLSDETCRVRAQLARVFSTPAAASCLQGIFSQPFPIHLKYEPARFSRLRFANPTKSIQDYISV
jgi:hypothetical protein